MQPIHIEKRITDAALWFFCGAVILILLTSCSPYMTTPAAIGSATPAASMTVTSLQGLAKNPTPTPPPPSCTVTGYLNFRTRPSRSAAVIYVLKAGERVTVIERGAWLKVSTGNKTGWIYGRYCR